jgi:RimJ/RimL family protein N-acetyltransferase
VRTRDTGAVVGGLSLEYEPPGGESLALEWLLAPSAWGRGYAAEACAAVLAWSDDALPGEPVVLCTQTANAASMRLAARLGFAEVERFEEFGAEQWFGVRWPPNAPGTA